MERNVDLGLRKRTQRPNRKITETMFDYVYFVLSLFLAFVASFPRFIFVSCSNPILLMTLPTLTSVYLQ